MNEPNGLPATTRLDLRRWPVVYAPPWKGEPGTAAVDTFYEELGRLLDRGERFAYVHDLRGSEPMSKARRERLGKYVRAERARLQARVAALAVVVDSRVLELFVSLFAKVVPPFVPLKTFYGDPDGAVEWALLQLRGSPGGVGPAFDLP